jgi:hypothetical protein
MWTAFSKTNSVDSRTERVNAVKRSAFLLCLDLYS